VGGVSRVGLSPRVEVDARDNNSQDRLLFSHEDTPLWCATTQTFLKWSADTRNFPEKISLLTTLMDKGAAKQVSKIKVSCTGHAYLHCWRNRITFFAVRMLYLAVRYANKSQRPLALVSVFS